MSEDSDVNDSILIEAVSDIVPDFDHADKSVSSLSVGGRLEISRPENEF